MTRPNETRAVPTKWRTLWLLLLFAVLMGIGVATVLVPELQDQRRNEASSSTGTSGSKKSTATTQE